MHFYKAEISPHQLLKIHKITFNLAFKNKTNNLLYLKIYNMFLYSKAYLYRIYQNIETCNI